MSIANQLKTHVFDPTIFNQRRCEFRIPKGVYLSNLRLGNIGCTVDNSSTQAPVRYPWHLGSYSLMQRISLMNGSIEIAELNYVGEYLAFANQNRTNANAYNVARSLNRSNWGFTVDDVQDLDTTIIVKDALNTISEIGSADATDTPKGWLDLSLVLPFLKATPHVNANEMHDLRLVIEWVTIPNQTQASADGSTYLERNSADKAFNKYLVGKSAHTNALARTVATLQGSLSKNVEVSDVTGVVKGMAMSGANVPVGATVANITDNTIEMSTTSTTVIAKDDVITFSKDSDNKVLTNFQIMQPTLICDEIVDEGALKKVKNVPITYVNLDHEVVNLPQMEDAVTVQQTQQRLRGFNDKMIRRMLMVNKYHEDRTNNMLASFESPALFGEQIQFLLNGSKMLPYKGITTPNEQLAMLNDTWGSRCQPQGSQLPAFSYSNRITNSWVQTDTTSERPSEGTNLCGTLSYGGFTVNQKVEELILEHQRGAQVYRSTFANGIIKVLPTTEAVDGVADKIKVLTEYNANIAVGKALKVENFAGNDWTSVNGTYAAVVDFSSPTTRDANDTYRLVSDHGYILNKSYTTANASGSFTTAGVVTPNGGQNERQSVVNSQAAIDKIFWGECVKTLKVSNNVVSINY